MGESKDERFINITLKQKMEKIFKCKIMGLNKSLFLAVVISKGSRYVQSTFSFPQNLGSSTIKTATFLKQITYYSFLPTRPIPGQCVPASHSHFSTNELFSKSYPHISLTPILDCIPHSNQSHLIPFLESSSPTPLVHRVPSSCNA